MPVIKTELMKYDAFPKLRKLRAAIEERIQLYIEQKRIKLRLDGVPKKKVAGLNYTLFADLRHAISDSTVKSFEFTTDDDERFCVTMKVSENGRKSLDRATLISTPWEVKGTCKCGKTVKVEVTLPPRVLEAATKEGKLSEPTVSVKRLGVKDDDEDEVGE